jgi:hypothetical protein
MISVRPGIGQSNTLDEAVELLLRRMSQDDAVTLAALEREEFPEYVDAFISFMEERLCFRERELMTLCAADDLETAVTRFMDAAWQRARNRLLH